MDHLRRLYLIWFRLQSVGNMSYQSAHWPWNTHSSLWYESNWRKRVVFTNRSSIFLFNLLNHRFTMLEFGWMFRTGLTFVVFDFRRQIVPNVTIVLYFVFHNQWNVGRHRQLYLGGEWCCFSERIQVATSERQCDWLLHFDDDRFFFLVDWRCLGQFDISSTNVAGGREFYTYYEIRNWG